MIFDIDVTFIIENISNYISINMGKGVYESLLASLIIISITYIFTLIRISLKTIIQRNKSNLICGFWMGINPSFDRTKENISIDLLHVSPGINGVKIRHWYYHYTGSIYKYSGKGAFENNELVSYYRGHEDYYGEVGVTIYRFIKGRLSGSMIQYSSQVSDDIRLIFTENNSNLYKVNLPITLRLKKLLLNSHFSGFNSALKFMKNKKYYAHIKTIEFSKESIPALSITEDEIARKVTTKKQ
ncbi:hypothetical protein [Pseudoalteromonas piscicida]|uniref:hypothetical protein n=1 Tax=Pseudoalteromonas piscicida TaxID=43662 RepID=UPI0027E409B7|nr:hypothetical protein [Pseudoalteromonas piscicida]WMO15962.1 hypothetical protein NI376_22260 [Pseudoalteromonas piscicida]